MGFHTLDGAPLLTWDGPEDAFEAWKECSQGRPCDYTGISYERLRGGSGIPWPCNDENPDGTVRLYGGRGFSHRSGLLRKLRARPPHRRPRWARSLIRAMAPSGRAIFKTAEYSPPHEEPDEDYPFRYTTGRTAYHFHTRTKTARSRQLQDAAPDAWVELSAEDAQRLGISEGDLVRVTSRRGETRSPGTGGRHPAGHRLRSLPLRLLGRRRIAPGPSDGCERTDHHGVGPGLEAAGVQERGGRGWKGSRAGTGPRSCPDHDGVPAGRGDRCLPRAAATRLKRRNGCDGSGPAPFPRSDQQSRGRGPAMNLNDLPGAAAQVGADPRRFLPAGRAGAR